MSGHTKGPWLHLIHEKDGEQRHVVETGPPAWVAHYPDGMTDEEIAANCDLISAAPELLEALEQVIEVAEGKHPLPHMAIDAARAAIAKATGKEGA